MKDLHKLQAGMEKLFNDDKAIRAALNKYDLLFNKNRDVIMSEAAGIMDARRRKAYQILKRLYNEYRTEIDGAINIMFDITTRQDRALGLARRLGGAR